MEQFSGGPFADLLEEEFSKLNQNCKCVVELGYGLSSMQPTGLIGIDAESFSVTRMNQKEKENEPFFCLLKPYEIYQSLEHDAEQQRGEYSRTFSAGCHDRTRPRFDQK